MAEPPPTPLGTPASPTGATPAQLLDTEVTAVGTLTSLEVRGELDMDTAHQITAAVEDALLSRPRILIVDLRAVTFCDCAGLRSLLRARRRATDSGATFHLGPASTAVLRLLEITGLGAALDVGSTVPPPRDRHARREAVRLTPVRHGAARDGSSGPAGLLPSAVG